MLSDNDSVDTTLISGDPEICKALLFESAISWAKEGHYVYYFTRKRFESLPPSFHDRSEPSADALKLVTFIYTPTYNDLVAQLVRLYTFNRPASVVLIDDLDSFARTNDGKNLLVHAAKCCAFVLNSAQACSKVTKRPVHVCAASFDDDDDDDDDDKKMRDVYGIYFERRFLVSYEPVEEEDDNGESRKVWVRKVDGKSTYEYHRLDDAVLVLRRVCVAREEEEKEERSDENEP